MYSWNNEKKFDEFAVSGSENVLGYTYKNERVKIFLNENGIEKAEHTVGDSTESFMLDQTKHVVVGEDNWQRDVYHFPKRSDVGGLIRYGLTKHKGPGTWSSLPHDFENHPEPGFEEAFFYLLDGEPKRGIQTARGQWVDGTPVNEIWPIADKTFCTIPIGYHPVVGEPGVKVSYIWAYVAKYPRWEKV